MSAMQRITHLYLSAITLLESYLTPMFGLGIRGYLAWVFFRSGLTKIQSWDSTLWLFENEYSVPYLAPELAAWMATATELTLPVFILLGLGSRVAASSAFLVQRHRRHLLPRSGYRRGAPALSVGCADAGAGVSRCRKAVTGHTI